MRKKKQEKPNGKMGTKFSWIARRLGVRYFEDGVGRSAAALAYYLLFSLFPMLIFLNSAIGALKISMPELMLEFERVLPEDVQGIISDYLSYISGLKTGTLLYAGLFLSVWMLTQSIGMLMSAVRRAYRVKPQTRFSLVVVPVLSVLLLLSVFIMLAISMISTQLLYKVDEYIRLPAGLIRFWGLLRLAIGPVYLFFILAAFYWIAGDRNYRFRQALPGAAGSLIAWMLATWGFSYYVSNLGSYSLLYGSLGAIIVLMLWLYLTGTILIMGGELNDIIARKIALQHREDKA